MADRISFALYDATTGAPLTGVVPSWVKYVDKLGNARTPPAITELGAGQYGFSPTDADEAAGVAYLLDAGAGAEPRRCSGAIHTPAAPFIAWHLEDNAGDLWAGASPTVVLWDDFDGNARTPPSVTTPGATTYLFAVTPSTADLELDVAFRLDSPAGAEPPYVTGSLERQTYVAPASALPTVGETIRTVLMGDAATVELIGSRLYPNQLPQGATLPAAVYTVVSGVPENSFTGQVATTLTASRVQIDCYARVYSQAHAAAKRIGEVLGDMAEADVAGTLETKRDTFDDVTQFHGVSMDFTIWI